MVPLVIAASDCWRASSSSTSGAPQLVAARTKQTVSFLLFKADLLGWLEVARFGENARAMLPFEPPARGGDAGGGVLEGRASRYTTYPLARIPTGRVTRMLGTFALRAR